MSENGTLNLLSVTALLKDALGTGPSIVRHGKKKVAGACFDKYKMLGAYVDEGDRSGAIKWALDQEWKDLKSAANRGTEIHAAAEQYALGVVPEYDEFLEPWVEQYRRFLEEHQPEYLMTEAPVYNPPWRYAGTLDGIAVIDGKTVVVDIKTTEWGPNAKDEDTGRPKARPPFSDVALQLTMYRHAELVGLLSDRVFDNKRFKREYVFDPEKHAEPMPETEGGVCVVLSPEDYLVVPVDTSERIWRYCRHVIQVAKFQNEQSKVVFSAPIQPKQAQGVAV